MDLIISSKSAESVTGLSVRLSINLRGSSKTTDMTNEEFAKTKQFILEQQAQFAVDIQQLREAQTQTERVMTHTGEVVGQTAEIVARLANVTHEGFKDVNAKINALVDSEIPTDEKFNALADSQKLTDEKINLLVDSQMQTGEDLRNLAALVDRHVSEGRNGNNLGS
jgi:hypothetical protein